LSMRETIANEFVTVILIPVLAIVFRAAVRMVAKCVDFAGTRNTHNLKTASLTRWGTL
jgi:hypothetical protein